MKPFFSFLILFLLLAFNSTTVWAQISPICNVEKFANQRTNNEQWNSLLDKACGQITAKKYSDALQSLEDAMKLDSMASKNEYTPNAYVEMMSRRLKRYLADAKESGVDPNATVESPAAVATITPSDAVKEEVKKQPEVVIETAPKIEEKKQEAVEQPKPVAVEEPVVKTESVEPTKVEVRESIENKNNAKADLKNNPPEIKFTDKDKIDFQEKGMQKVKQLEGFIMQIGSKSTPLSLKTQSTTSAIKLFENEEKTVQITSINSSDKPKYKVRSYLTKLGVLNYSDVKIEWADFQYASDFIKGLDGNYYGYIIFQQRFNGTSLDKNEVYSDITTKKIEIILKLYEKAEQGQVTEQWDVFLGDISVVQTQAK